MSSEPILKFSTDRAQRLASALDWDRFVRLAVDEARTEPGKAILASLAEPAQWTRDVAESNLRQQETLETAALLDREALWGPLTGLGDPNGALDRLGRDAVLELSELTLIRGWIYALDSWAQTPREEIRGERIRRTLTALPDPYEPLRILDRVLTPEGELSERASPKLAQLHQDIRATRRDISSVLDHLVKSLAQRGVLQESFSDVRDGRYVIPVKISQQNEVDGNVYEASASRQTVFIEPREVSALNNKLRRLQNDLLQEVWVVLEETSRKLRPFVREIADGSAALAHWDSVQARARLSRRYGGKSITVTDERSFRLQLTAHPLLYWALAPEQIIRNQVDFGEPVRTLLLTGPNTGGKTVLLKTLGLAGVCARTGFPFPGADEAVVPFFDAFFADLGDPQSIEQHLSSFSGHVLRFREILEAVTDRSLVLLDELNTATDPEEGAALGRAFLETVMARGAVVVTTTHDPSLKALSLSDRRILTASMAFDERARTPTYRLVLGVPGRSRALETAERLGIPAEVLDKARSYLSREHKEFEGLLARLEHDVSEAARAKHEASVARHEAEKLRKEWTERTSASVNELLDRTRQKLRRILEQAQDEVRSSVKKLDEMRSRREIDETRGGLNRTFGAAAQEIEQALREEAPELAQDLRENLVAPPEPEKRKEDLIQTGLTVRVPKWKTTGKVLEIQGQKVKVAMGSIQMSMSLADIELLPAGSPLAAQSGPKFAPGPASGGRSRMVDVDRPPAPAREIDLRGRRFEEAMSALTAYLDQAFRSGAYAEVTVIHGLGTGALREGARELLGDLPYVKTFHDGGVGRGGTGATVVEFDRS